MKKEFLAIWSDKKSRIIIIVPPLVQLLLFSFAVTLEVKNIDILNITPIEAINILSKLREKVK